MPAIIRALTGLAAWAIGTISVNQLAVAQESLEAILKIQQGGAGVAAAHTVAEKLVAGGTNLETVLSKVKQANPVAKNWLLAVAQAIADKQDQAKTKSLLEKVLADQSADGETALLGSRSPGGRR